MPSAPPLPSLFAKAEAAHVQVSPHGKWLGWLARTDGRLNLFVAPLPLAAPSSPHQPNSVPGARQLTAAADRDICFTWRFTHDERRIVHLRETRHGSELYHLFAIDIAPIVAGGAPPVESGRDLLAAHPQLTCAVGFVGGLQLWLPTRHPQKAILATGSGSLLWSLSSVDLDTGQLETLCHNPAFSKFGLTTLVAALAAHVIVLFFDACLRLASFGMLSLPTERIASPPALAVQYFVDGRSGELVGRAEAVVAVLLRAPYWTVGMRYARVGARRGQWTPLAPATPLAQLNMQLIGSGGASGTLRMDALPADAAVADGGPAGGSVAVHTCDTHDTTAYVRYPGGAVVAHDSRADLAGFVVGPASRRVEAVLVAASRMHVVPISEEGERFKRALEALACHLGLPPAPDGGCDLVLASRPVDDSVWVVRAASDTRPGRFYLVERPYDPPSPRFLFSARPALDALHLAPMAAVSIVARDGERLPAYLTVPAGRRHPGALALLIHGGPNARDFAGFDPEVQALVGCGIAVLQVQYRGSTGFGMRFAGLGNGAVRAMHNDIADARRWAIRQGHADPRQLAVVGASWGGYLALGAAMGIAEPTTRGSADGAAVDASEAAPDETPDEYAAVVAIVPLCAVGAANDSPAFRSDPLVARYWAELYGPAVANDRRAAEPLSPMHCVERLRGETLLIHGERDPRVPRAHGDALAAAAERLGVRGAHLTYAHEGHSIRREPNLLHMWHTILRFLCRALELPPPPPLDARMTEGHTATVHWESAGVLGGAGRPEPLQTRRS